jgi:hypothetical protein
MTSIEFTTEELELLRRMLKRGVNEMELEIAHTDTHEFKQMLKHRKDVLEHLVGKTEAAPASV